MVSYEYMELENEYKKKVTTYIFVGMMLSIFLTSYFFRREFTGDIAAMNITFIGLMAIYLFINNEKINVKILLVLMCIATYIVFNDYLINNEGLNTIIRNICISILPISLLLVEINKDYVENIFIAVTRTLNFFTVIIFSIGILDYLFNVGIMRYVAESFARTLLPWIGYRYTSYMGHPLFTKEIFIYFFFFNNISNKYLNKKLMNKYIVLFLSLIGVLITGSKAGVILILVSIIFDFNKKSKYINIILSLTIITMVYYMGFFDMTISRLKNNTLTSGRTEASDIINELEIVKTKIFIGYGENVQSFIEEKVGTTIATASMEYPIRIWTLKYGILCTILIVSIIFIYPVLYLLRRKSYYLCFVFLIKTTEINMYNGLVYKPDNMALFMIFTVITI